MPMVTVLLALRILLIVAQSSVIGPVISPPF
jgi:hypothetical protein